MANGYDTHSLANTGLKEAAGASTAAVRDKRFTKNGIGWRSEAREAASGDMPMTTMNPGPLGQTPPPIMYGFGDYPGGTAARRRGQVNETALAWQSSQEAASRPARPRDTVMAGFMENGEWGGFPCEAEARMALAVLSQFADGDTIKALQSAIEDQFGAPGTQDAADAGMEPDDSTWMGAQAGEPWMDEAASGDLPPWLKKKDGMDEAAIQEAPLTAKQRDKLPDSAFALPGRQYPIDTPERARAAMARVQQFGSASDKKRVMAAVKKKYPDMEFKATS